MKLSELAGKIIVDPRKLTEYALNPDSPRGRHKARVFERVLGYTRANHRALLTEIEAKAPEADVELQSQDEFGSRYRADLQIEGPEGQQATICTGWIVPEEQDEVRLVTLWVKGE